MAKAGRPRSDSVALPTWFNIETYRQVKAFGAAEWFQQLTVRVVLDEDFPFNPAWTQRCLHLVQADPHLTIARLEATNSAPQDEDLVSVIGSGRMTHIDLLINHMTIDGYSAYGIRPATNGEITRASIPASHLPVELLKDHKNLSDMELAKVNELWDELERKPYVGSCFWSKYRRFATIDLSFPDAILKKNFAEYLKAQRKNAADAESPFFKNQDFSVWYNSGVLPYLDLRLWEITTGQTFRWSAFVDALNLIADQPVGSEDACRKTVRALHSKLIDNRTIRMLNFQAIKEQSGSANKSGKLFVR
jgi:hypothetical protein